MINDADKTTVEFEPTSFCHNGVINA